VSRQVQELVLALLAQLLVPRQAPVGQVLEKAVELAWALEKAMGKATQPQVMVLGLWDLHKPGKDMVVQARSHTCGFYCCTSYLPLGSRHN
jgi:hypothetical protein